MIKLLKKYQIQLTPFEATKDWALNNTVNDDLLLFESTGSEDGLPFALEYLDYGDGSKPPYENSNCDIALEQQNADLATLEEGLKVNGPFYPTTDPQNTDGTYQRPIYHQIETTFYNTYFDPSKIWGSENIDFELSKTKRVLADKFRLIGIPRLVFGDKIVPTSINMVEDSFDNQYYITDDGNGNLLVGNNLFLKQQELGEYTNSFAPGYATYCDHYFNAINVTDPQSVVTYYSHTASFFVTVTGLGPFTYKWYSGSVAVSDNSRITGSSTTFLQINNAQFSDAGSYRIYVADTYGDSVYSNYASLTVLDNSIIAHASESVIVDPTLLYGSLFERPPFVEDSIPVVASVSLLTGSVINMVISVYGKDTASVNVGFNSGYIFDVLKIMYGGNDTGSINAGFSSGYIFDVLVPIPVKNETGSVNMGFYSGSLQTLVTPMVESDTISSITVGLLIGSCQ